MADSRSSSAPANQPATFRRIRRTNDAVGWFRLIFILIVTIGLGVLALVLLAAEHHGACYVFAFLPVLVVVGVFLTFQVFRPRVLEFVVEGGIIRTGPTDRLDRQWVLPLTEVLCIYVNKREHEVHAERKQNAFNASLGGDVLIGWPEYQALLEFLRVHHPEVRIVDVATILNNRKAE